MVLSVAVKLLAADDLDWMQFQSVAQSLASMKKPSQHRQHGCPRACVVTACLCKCNASKCFCAYGQAVAVLILLVGSADHAE